MAEKHYDPAQVLDYNKRIGIRREPEDRQRIRAWAGENGIAVNATGRIPEQVFMDWIDAHAGQPNPVIGHSQVIFDGIAYRLVKVICHRCARTHEHGGQLGSRADVKDFIRVPHCHDPYAGGPGYHIDDQLDIAEWELKAQARNQSVRNARAAMGTN